MLPILRASLANRLLQKNLRVNQIAHILNVTPSAVTQYANGLRGKKRTESEREGQIIDALAEKATQRIEGNMGPLSTAELLDTAHEIIAVTRGETMLTTSSVGKGRESAIILKGRLQLELKAAQKCLDLANRARDEYTRLLLRMVASDSIRHADIVSQMISWIESGQEFTQDVPDRELLTEILAIEDNANESSLRKSVKINHSVARLLLESIDMDEEKHERLIGKLAENNST